MRNTIRIVAVLAALAGAATYGWKWLFPDDEAQIHALLERIADGIGAGADDGEGNVSRLARAASLRHDFDSDVTIDAGPPFEKLRGRDAIIGTAATVHGSVRNLVVSFTDVTVDVDRALGGATANLTAEARFDAAGGGRSLEAREVDVAFKRIDGSWVVSAVTLVQTLRRLDQP
jgi:hypothetical protein